MKIVGVIINIFLPGIGTLLVGKIVEGIVQIVLYLIGIIFCFTIIGTVIGIPLCLVVWIWAIVSAATYMPRRPADDDVLDYVSRDRHTWQKAVRITSFLLLFGALALLIDRINRPESFPAPTPVRPAPVEATPSTQAVTARAAEPKAGSYLAKAETAPTPPQRYLGPIPRAGMTPDEIIQQAEAFDKWFQNPQRPKPTDPTEALESARDIGDKDKQIRSALRSIPKSASQYAHAQKLIAGYEKQDAEALKQVKVAVAEYQSAALEARKALAKALQRNYWDAGLDITTNVSGPNSTVLNLRYVLFSNPVVHKLLNADSFTDTCKKVGFTKIIFTDGYDKTWTYSLTPEKPAGVQAPKPSTRKPQSGGGGSNESSAKPVGD